MMVKYMYIIVIIMFIIGNMIFIFLVKTFIDYFIKFSIYSFKSFFFFNNLFNNSWFWALYTNSFFSFFCLWGGFGPFNFSFFNSYSWKWFFLKIKFIMKW
uniref:NADH dehydrogenase subunit 4L n=1 Tax=Abraxas suspecta TaxID=1986468 RepID=A0A1X9T4K6_9NEOP|nr:NADH dehydrogenase subunit 4L [Abraxas suspecta]ARR28300.1 NADH dehydrogenase subunit 4L [Abraxas suspecta]